MRHAFTPAWLAADPAALALLDDGYRHPERHDDALRAAARPIDPAVHAALVAQNSGPFASPARAANLQALRQPGATVVVTGQQMGLFLGPLYTVFKAAAAVVNARAFAARSGRPCVPLFWMQTEDHDRDEIDVCVVAGADGGLVRLGVGAGVENAEVMSAEVMSAEVTDAATERVPIGAQRLGAGVIRALAELAEALEDAPFAAEVMELLTAAYQPDATWSEACASVMAHLFADEGLLLLDPRDPAIAALAAPLHRRCLDQAEAIASALQTRHEAIEAAGFVAKVHIRPGAPLCFYAPEGRDGPRYRLAPLDAPVSAHVDSDVARDRSWQLVGHPDGAVVSDADLRAQQRVDPGCLTTSALLRPLLQDTLLPTVAYVGGPGELAYFAQLPPLYALLGVPMPLLVPRARFVVVDGRIATQLDKLGLRAAQACGDEATLRSLLAERAVADGFMPVETIAAQLQQALDPAFASLGDAMERLDPNLGKTVARSRGNIDETVQKLLGRYEAALARRDGDTTARLARVRAALLPDGAPQERVLGVPGFAAQVGFAPFVRAVMAACVPFDGALRELRL